MNKSSVISFIILSTILLTNFYTNQAHAISKEITKDFSGKFKGGVYTDKIGSDDDSIVRSEGNDLCEAIVNCEGLKCKIQMTISAGDKVSAPSMVVVNYFEAVGSDFLILILQSKSKDTLVDLSRMSDDQTNDLKYNLLLTFRNKEGSSSHKCVGLRKSNN